MIDVEWFDTLPEEVGIFWFYGKKVASDKEDEWFCVKTIRISNGVMSIIEGAFLFDWPCRHGKFCRALLPKPPSDL